MEWNNLYFTKLIYFTKYIILVISKLSKLPVKKSKPEPAKPSKKPAPSKDEDGEPSWEIGRNRFVKLTEFKGKWYINIREFYMDGSGDLKPGKKGIMLTMEQWQKFKGIVGEIDDAVKRHV